MVCFNVRLHWIHKLGTELYFFFSSRRRHTRLQGDWSSDVCSSDLVRGHPGKQFLRVGAAQLRLAHAVTDLDRPARLIVGAALAVEREEGDEGRRRVIDRKSVV